MSASTKSMRSPLGRVRGLGSAKTGTEHWLLQRMTAMALVPLSLYILIGFFSNVAAGDYNSAIYWLQSPIVATFMIMLIVVGFRHGVAGLQIIIEDYLHNENAKIGILYVVKFTAIALVILASLSIAKIFFGV